MFAYIPLAARIGDQILCVHGGIGPGLNDINDIKSIARPVETFGRDTVDSLVWSDPSDSVLEFEASSTRGTGYNFGISAVRRFLAQSGLRKIIRAHECVHDGFEGNFSNTVMTVFSASNYCGLVGNQSAVLEIVSATTIKPRQFAPLPWLLRKDVTFSEGKVQLGTAALSRSRGRIGSGPQPKRIQANINSCRTLPRLFESQEAPVTETPNAVFGLPLSKVFEMKRRKSIM
jgi:protein phosphatase